MPNILEDIKWVPFQIDSLFNVNIRGKRLTNKNRIEGLYPFVTAGEFNNGISTFIGNEELITYNNAITIDMFGHSFYQKSFFKCDDNITVLKNKNMNNFNSYFLVAQLNKLSKKYSYGNQVRPNRLSKDKIMLPVDEKGLPNWKFMEIYIKNQELVKLNNLIDHFQSNIETPFEQTMPKIEEVNWEVFNFNDVFNLVQRGKRLTKANQLTGKTPYISSTSLNNGVDNFISNDIPSRQFKNGITIANSGSVGISFYHKYNIVASDHVTFLQNKNFNRYSYLFLSTMVNRLSEKYSFNREINNKRINREKILLPVDKKGILNYQFMETYMQTIEYKQTKKILNHLILKKEILTTSLDI